VLQQPGHIDPSTYCTIVIGNVPVMFSTGALGQAQQIFSESNLLSILANHPESQTERAQRAQLQSEGALQHLRQQQESVTGNGIATESAVADSTLEQSLTPSEITPPELTSPQELTPPQTTPADLTPPQTTPTETTPTATTPTDLTPPSTDNENEGSPAMKGKAASKHNGKRWMRYQNDRCPCLPTSPRVSIRFQICPVLEARKR